MGRKISAGLQLFRRRGELVIFLVHPGGPFWAKQDAGAWSLPKGELNEGEDLLEAAKREFTEETGFKVDGEFLPLETIRQAGGKIIQAWAIEADCDPAQVRSNLFTMEWPPKSGRKKEFPEIDRARWFAISEARPRMNPAQVGLIDQLLLALAAK